MFCSSQLTFIKDIIHLNKKMTKKIPKMKLKMFD